MEVQSVIKCVLLWNVWANKIWIKMELLLSFDFLIFSAYVYIFSVQRLCAHMYVIFYSLWTTMMVILCYRAFTEVFRAVLPWLLQLFFWKTCSYYIYWKSSWPLYLESCFLSRYNYIGHEKLGLGKIDFYWLLINMVFTRSWISIGVMYIPYWFCYKWTRDNYFWAGKHKITRI